MITIHPALFNQQNGLKIIAAIEAKTGLTATIGQRYATLEPVATNRARGM